jgi:[ribosomal protein S18]-alanine N-acetyltransferase
MTSSADHSRPEVVPPRIRPLTAADLPRVREISAGLKDAPQWTEAAWLSVVGPMATPRRIALAAIETTGGAEPAGGALLGFGVASILRPQAELETIAVAREAQRQGIGRTLLHALTAQLTQQGIAELWLEVRASNQAALALYRAAGFAQTGRRPNYYRNPAEDGLLLTLRLSA